MALRSNKRWWWIVSVLTLCIPTTTSLGQVFTPEEIKASYILKLRPYTTLDNPPRKAGTICYYEKPGVPASESVGQILSKYAEKKGADNSGLPPLTIKRFQAIRNLIGCDIFYIPADEEGNIDNILTALGTSSTLTISATPRFIMRGGMIGFVLDEDSHVRMEANLTNLKKRGVQVDAQILELMQQVVSH